MGLLAFCWCAASALAADWPQFRGPNGSGITEGSALPVRFSEDENLLWKTELPPGHSSPVVAGDRIFLTAYEGEKLLVMALDRLSGAVLWRREAPRPRQEPYQPTHGPASPSPATDGENVYVFFGDFGALSYDAQGNERWRRPLGPFRNINGHGSSPILADGKLLIVCDQEIDSYLIALDTESGETVWKAERPDFTRGYGTAGIFRPADAAPQVVVPGSYRVVAYDLATGERLWWVTGFSSQLKGVPVFAGDTIYINAWAYGGSPGLQEGTAEFREVIAEFDRNQDQALARDEVPADFLGEGVDWDLYDLDDDGLLGERDWRFFAARRSQLNNLVAIRPAGRRGDLTDTAVLWRYARSLPNAPSPLFYQGALYLVKDGGIFSSLDPVEGRAHHIGRLRDAMGKYWASPIAGDGKILTVSENCQISAIAPGPDWSVTATSELDGECFATPAIADGRVYVRTLQALYSFGHPGRISQGRLLLRGDEAVYELQMPLAELGGRQANPDELLGALALRAGNSAGQRVDQECGEQADQPFYACRATYRFPRPAESIVVRCEFPSITSPGHVHVLRSGEGRAARRTVFTSASQEAEILFTAPPLWKEALGQMTKGSVWVVASPLAIFVLVVTTLAGRTRRELAYCAGAFGLFLSVGAMLEAGAAWIPSARYIEAATALAGSCLAAGILLVPGRRVPRWPACAVVGGGLGIMLAKFLAVERVSMAYPLAGALGCAALLIALLGAIRLRAVAERGERIGALLLLAGGLGWLGLQFVS